MLPAFRVFVCMAFLNKSLKEIAHRRKKNIRLIVAGMFFVAVSLMVSFFFGEMGFFHFSTMRNALKQSEREIEALEAGNNRLLLEIEGLRTDPFYVETIARERLGLVKKGEIVYEFYPH
ncbi:MAG: septum formation initiator family protein [Nitrospirota bacterium]